MTILNFKNVLYKFFPMEDAEIWDNTYSTFYNNKNIQKKQINNTLICLDITKQSIEFALKNNCNVIITHHPFIFDPENIEDEFLSNPYKKDLFSKLQECEVEVIHLHTNFDNNEKGMKLGYEKALSKKLETFHDSEYGFILQEKNSLNSVEEMIFKNFSLKIINHNICDKEFEYNNLIFLPGAGGSELFKYVNRKQDIIVTSDLKWSTWINVNELNLNVIEVSHKIEEVFIDVLFDVISSLKEFNGQIFTFKYQNYIAK